MKARIVMLGICTILSGCAQQPDMRADLVTCKELLIKLDGYNSDAKAERAATLGMTSFITGYLKNLTQTMTDIETDLKGRGPETTIHFGSDQ